MNWQQRTSGKRKSYPIGCIFAIIIGLVILGTVILPLTLMFVDIKIPIISGLFPTSYNIKSPFFLFDSKEKILITAIEKKKLRSSSTGGGRNFRSYQTRYILQKIDATSMNILNSVELESASDAEIYYFKIYGTSENLVWLFYGDLQAYNPYTLKRCLDVNSLEELNPQIKDKLPKNNNEYKLNPHTKQIIFTALDGITYTIDNNNFSVAKYSLQQERTKQEIAEKKMKELIKEENMPMYSLNKLEYLYKYREFDYLQCSHLGNRINADFLQKLKNLYQDIDFNFNDLLITKFATNQNTFFTASDEELEDLDKKHDRNSNEPKIKKFYIGKALSNEDKLNTGSLKNGLISSNQTFLNGCMIIDKTRLDITFIRPINAYLLAYKTSTSDTSKYMFAAVNTKAETVWSINTNLNKIKSFDVVNNLIYVGGVGNQDDRDINDTYLKLDLETGSFTSRELSE